MPAEDRPAKARRQTGIASTWAPPPIVGAAVLPTILPEVTMVEFVVVLDPTGMTNPDTDLKSLVPNLVEHHSAGRVQSDGWAFASDDTMHLFFSAASADQGAYDIRAALASAPVLDNDLSALSIDYRLVHHGAVTSIHPPAALGSSVPDVAD